MVKVHIHIDRVEVTGATPYDLALLEARIMAVEQEFRDALGQFTAKFEEMKTNIGAIVADLRSKVTTLEETVASSTISNAAKAEILNQLGGLTQSADAFDDSLATAPPPPPTEPTG